MTPEAFFPEPGNRKTNASLHVCAWPVKPFLDFFTMLRKVILLNLVLLLSLSLHCTEEKETTITLYGGAPSGLIIRSEPSTSGEKLGLIKYGDPVTVLEQKEEILTIQDKKGKWTRIGYGNVQGWVFGGFLLANPPAQEAKKDEKDQGNHPTVTSLQAGDVGCYVDLKYPDGKTETWYANFDVCDEPVLNKKVKFTRGKGNVLADSCEGDPECQDTKEVDMIETITAVK